MGQYDDVDWGATNGWWLGTPKGKGMPPKSPGILSGTGLDERAALLNSIFNPIEGIGNSMQASRDMVAPGRTGWDRVKSAGDMLSGVAATVAPAMVGAKPATALMDGLLGWSPTRQAAGDVAGQFAADESGALKLYHGSPHSFDRFSMDKIGTGEGAQAYGHGLYFAENETIARTYRDKVSSMLGKGDLTVDGRKIDWNNPIEGAAFEVMRHGGNRAAAAEFAGRTYAKGSPVAEIIRSGVDLPEVKSPGHMYEVNVNANPEDFLNWDAPLSEQPQAVRDALAKIAPQSTANARGDMGYTLNEAANEVASRDGSWSKAASKANITPALREAGIPGIRYLDAGSRTAGDGSRNYVVFDENLISILRKYGLAPGMIGAGMMARPNDAEAKSK